MKHFEVMIEDLHGNCRIISLHANHRGDALYKSVKLHPDFSVIGIREAFNAKNS
jgi:hypothetical protein